MAEPADSRAAAGEPRMTKLDVLLVDDNEDAAEILAVVLRRHGHEVRTAYRAEAALCAIGEREPDFALLDIGLPDMDGTTLAKKIREQHRHVRLVALTGHGLPSDRDRSAAAGFESHLVKPVAVADLLRLLKDE
jgi:two-component system CheB/CheR fusion protein